MQGQRVRPADPGAILLRQLRELGEHRLLEPGRGLAGGGGECDRRPPVVCRRLVGEQHQQPGHRRGLAGAGAAGEHGGPASGRTHRGGFLFRAEVLAADALQRRSERRLVDLRRWLGVAGHQVGAHLALEAVVAVEVEQGVLHAHHAGLGQRRLAHRRPPVGRLRPREVGREGGHGSEVDADRAVSHRADCKRDGQLHPLVVLAAEVADPLGDVDVGGLQQAGGVERRQQPGGLTAQPLVVLADGLEQLGHEATPSSRSESASTRATGGRQENTPHGSPSSSGVSGPHIPRR